MHYKSGTVRIPKRFYDDHVKRGHPAPVVVKTTMKHYWIDTIGEKVDNLLVAAEFYADGPVLGIGLRSSARATARALRAVR